jgi:hypothetical protein
MTQGGDRDISPLLTKYRYRRKDRLSGKEVGDQPERRTPPDRSGDHARLAKAKA